MQIVCDIITCDPSIAVGGEGDFFVLKRNEYPCFPEVHTVQRSYHIVHSTTQIIHHLQWTSKKTSHEQPPPLGVEWGINRCRMGTFLQFNRLFMGSFFYIYCIEWDLLIRDTFVQRALSLIGRFFRKK